MKLHSLKKAVIYFGGGKPYWRLVDNSDVTVSSKIGPFFLNLRDRLEDGHYNLFDDAGLPVRVMGGKTVHSYSTVFSYALAHWQRYLETGDEAYTEQLYKTIEFFKKNHEIKPYGAIVFPFKGLLSAMNQGEALSILARAQEHRSNPEWLELAQKILKPYNVLVAEGGVFGKFTGEKDLHWYEEKATIPGKHILNGMIYSLVGLWDIHKAIPQLTEAKTYFDRGIDWVERALPKYDTGYWSNYWFDDAAPPHYIASAMYHNLHICQLRYLHAITSRDSFLLYAQKFERYNQSFIKRFAAGGALALGKLRKR